MSNSVLMGYFKPSTVDGYTFNFLNKFGYVSDNYDDASRTKLWNYNLHYQNDLAINDSAAPAYQRKNLILNWIRYNKDLSGIGWDPYCVSLRLVNWVKWISYNSLKPEDDIILESLRDQAHFLRHNIEYHLGANHLIANAKGLIFAGALFQDSRAESWFLKGINLLNKELNEQFLDDGAHYELSPMYHSIILWDLLDLLALEKTIKHTTLETYSRALSEKFQLGMRWLKNVIHPDGYISFFNDATFAAAPTYAELKAYAEMLGLRVQEVDTDVCEPNAKILVPSGFGIIDWPNSSKVITNFAQIGPAYQPGHSHADTLSFELSILGERIIVNSGVSEYAIGSARLKQRSTAAHNTVEINGQNSSDVWSSFRVGKRAKLSFQDEKNINGVSLLRCAHDGYSKLFKKVQHLRTFEAKSFSLKVTDEVHGYFEFAIARFYLVPNTKVISRTDQEVILETQSGKSIVASIIGGSPEIRPSEWFPKFGEVVQNLCIEIKFKEPKIDVLFDWSD